MLGLSDVPKAAFSLMGHSMSIQPLILGHVLRFTYHFPYLLGMMYYALLQSIAYSMMFVYKIWPSEYLIFW